jgi:catalase
MPLSTDEKELALARNLLQDFDKVNGGEHPGFRAVHAKGVMLTGVFQASPQAATLTRAPHARGETPVTVRFSDFAGIPTVPDNSEHASPRGCAIRFHLGPHVHTDIVAHSHNGFPVRTADEFEGFLRALAATDPSQPHPNAIEKYLSAHPRALEFVQAPKPFPTSFARESYYAVSAFKFTTANGASRFGRYRILPELGNQYLEAGDAAAQRPNFLFEDMRQRVSREPIRFRIMVQLAEEGDTVDDATVRWPENRPQLRLGELALDALVAENDADRRRYIFDPIPRVEGIEASADPLFQPRADLYLLSGRRRRAAEEQKAKAATV